MSTPQKDRPVKILGAIVAHWLMGLQWRLNTSMATAWYIQELGEPVVKVWPVT